MSTSGTLGHADGTSRVPLPRAESQRGRRAAGPGGAGSCRPGAGAELPGLCPAARCSKGLSSARRPPPPPALRARGRCRRPARPARGQDGTFPERRPRQATPARREKRHPRGGGKGTRTPFSGPTPLPRDSHQLA